MRVCLDTNVLLRLFNAATPFTVLRSAFLDGYPELVCSNEILLEWEEMATRLFGRPYWNKVTHFLDVLIKLGGGLIQMESSFRFQVITADPEDNKFVDCAIAANADFVLTEDRHFAALIGSGYRPQPIAPQAFIDKYLLPLP